MNLDLNEIKKAIAKLKPNNQLYEIRILKGKMTISGYFKGTESLDGAFKTIDLRDANVFITLNKINDACYGRTQHECFRQEKVTTSDGDIVAYDWLLIDLDPKRPTGISSTSSELSAAKEKAGVVFRYLKSKGFSEPIVALSGNGLHLLYRIELPNTEENKNIVERCLKSLDFLFSDDVISIDTSVFNPSRISKLYGTMAQKGANTEERPHRLSKILRAPEEICKTGLIYLEALANEYPEEADNPPQIRTRSSVQTDFDIEQWLSDHRIGVSTVKRNSKGTKYILDECPFDGSHKAPDSAVFKLTSGAVAFKCLHNSCSGRTWQDLRLKFEPNAYDREDTSDFDRRMELGWREHLAYNRNRQDIGTEIEETPENPRWETIGQILARPKEVRVTVRTGTREIDKLIGGGLAKGEISVVSGLRASAKSTLLSQWALNAVDLEYNVMFYSGELKDTRFAEWFMCQAAGRNNVTMSTEYENIAWVKNDEIKKRIAKWLEQRFWLYNNKYGNNFGYIKDDLEKRIDEFKADLIFMDNLAILDLAKYQKSAWGDNQYNAQTEFVKELKELAIKMNCHICMVAHPKKTDGFLRLQDIAGTANISNLVDTAFIVHRNNKDFRDKFTQMFRGERDYQRAMEASNIVEIAKDRECGTQDRFIPLYFELGTRRMLNSKDEYTHYGWETAT